MLEEKGALPMSKWLKTLFLIHAVAAAIGGLALFVVPGRALGLLGWMPIDTVLSRVLGAALLALAWGSWRGWRGATWERVALLVEVEVAFSVLTTAALLYVGLAWRMNWYAFGLLAVFAAFAVAWVIALWQVRRARER